jgi:hypothetical protein
MKNTFLIGILAGLLTVAAFNGVIYGWYFVKVIRTADRVLRLNNIPIVY